MTQSLARGEVPFPPSPAAIAPQRRRGPGNPYGARDGFSSFEAQPCVSDEWTHHKKRLVFVASSLVLWAALIVPIYALVRLF